MEKSRVLGGPLGRGEIDVFLRLKLCSFKTISFIF